MPGARSAIAGGAAELELDEETGRVVRSYQMNIMNTDTGNQEPDIIFDPPVLRGVIGYTVQNGKVIAGAPGDATASLTPSRRGDSQGEGWFAPGAGAPLIDASQAAQDLSLFWYNGNDWVKTTSLVNTADNTVSFTGSRAGRFQIRVALRAPGIALTRVYPRIITPNADGWNDQAIFQFDNPELLPLSGKIYDITGTAVADLKPGPNPDTSLEWDGKDSSGMVVPGGIYLYQVTAKGTSMTGTIVVAR